MAMPAMPSAYIGSTLAGSAVVVKSAGCGKQNRSNLGEMNCRPPKSFKTRVALEGYQMVSYIVALKLRQHQQQ